MLQRDFKHLAVDMFLTEEEGQKVLKVDCHFGKRKALASIRTCTSHVQVGRLGVAGCVAACSLASCCCLGAWPQASGLAAWLLPWLLALVLGVVASIGLSSRPLAAGRFLGSDSRRSVARQRYHQHQQQMRSTLCQRAVHAQQTLWWWH